MLVIASVELVRRLSPNPSPSRNPSPTRRRQLASQSRKNRRMRAGQLDQAVSLRVFGEALAGP